MLEFKLDPDDNKTGDIWHICIQVGRKNILINFCSAVALIILQLSFFVTVTYLDSHAIFLSNIQRVQRIVSWVSIIARDNVMLLSDLCYFLRWKSEEGLLSSKSCIKL